MAVSTRFRAHRPDGTESLAMKGLLLLCQGDSSGGYDFVRKGLRNDLTSPVCWHVFGIMYRMDKNYVEAAKCYVNALKYDKENVQIVRDLAILQSQLGQWAALVDTRNSLLQSKPGLRANWTALAVAYDMKGDKRRALKVLESYEDTLVGFPAPHDFEHSENLLYHATLLIECEQYDAAYAYLEKLKPQILAKTTVIELQAEALLKAGRASEARAKYQALVEINPDSAASLAGFVEASSAVDGKSALQVYKSLQEKYPKSDLITLRLAEASSSEEFRGIIKSYIQGKLERGVPSVYVSVKPFLPARYDTIKAECEEILANLEDSTSRAWGNLLLAQLVDYHGEYKRALELADSALKLLPEMPEIHMIKARFAKHAGNYGLAAQIMNDAQNLDSRDRFIHTKAAKYRLRNDENDAAEKLMAVFTRNEAIGGAIGDLRDMQCAWYMVEDGESYMRQGKYALALKRLHTVLTIYADWVDDPFDFHVYAFRKGAMRAYRQMLFWSQTLQEQPLFLQAARDAVRVYCHLHDNPKVREEELAAKEQTTPPDGVPDPFGYELLQSASMDSVLPFLKPLRMLAPQDLDVNLMTFDVYSRREGGGPVALQALKAAYAACPTSGQVHLRIVRYRVSGSSDDGIVPAGESLEDFNEKFTRAATSPEQIMCAAEGATQLGKSPDAVFELFRKSPPVPLLKQALGLLRTANSDRVDEFRVLCTALYPLSDQFR